MKKYDDSFIFVRPSGTENVVRIYIECSSENDIGLIYDEVYQKIK